MRRRIIYGLIGLLIVVIVLDYQRTTTDNQQPVSFISQQMTAAVSPPPPVTAPPFTAAPTATPTETDLQQVLLTLTALDIPPTVTLTPTPFDSAAVTHTLQSGETLYSLAQTYGTSVDGIMTANNIVDPTRLLVGTLLVIPGSEGVIPSITPFGFAAPTVTQPAQAVANLPTPTLGTIIPADVPLPTSFNSLPIDTIIVMPPNVRQHLHEIYAWGQELGNNPRAFSKVGDSTIEYPYFLAPFETRPYNLGGYAYLQQVIDYYAGSFDYPGVAVRRGLHTWSVMDSMWAPKPPCNPGEHMLACEFRLHQPSVLFIQLGSNDVGIPESTEKNFREIVEYAINSGVIPILITKADRHDGPGNTNNNIIRRVAADYAVPLWDFDLIAGTIPGRGLDQDGVHMTTFYAHDYTSPVAMTRGHGVHDLTALMVLDAIWRELNPTDQ